MINHSLEGLLLLFTTAFQLKGLCWAWPVLNDDAGHSGLLTKSVCKHCVNSILFIMLPAFNTWLLRSCSKLPTKYSLQSQIKAVQDEDNHLLVQPCLRAVA